MSNEKKKDEMIVLFPEKEVCGVKIKPWTYRQFSQLFPWIQEVRIQFKEKDIKQDQLREIFEKPEERIDDILNLLEFILPILPELVARTIGEDKEKIFDWEFDRTIKVSLSILIQNIDRIKNLFGLVREIKSLES